MQKDFRAYCTYHVMLYLAKLQLLILFPTYLDGCIISTLYFVKSKIKLNIFMNTYSGGKLYLKLPMELPNPDYEPLPSLNLVVLLQFTPHWRKQQVNRARRLQEKGADHRRSAFDHKHLQRADWLLSPRSKLLGVNYITFIHLLVNDDGPNYVSRVTFLFMVLLCYFKWHT